MYHMRRLAQVNELISHSRIIILQVAQEKQCLRL